MGTVLLSISAPFIRRLTERTVSQFPEPEPYDDSPAGRDGPGVARRRERYICDASSRKSLRSAHNLSRIGYDAAHDDITLHLAMDLAAP